MRNTAVVVVILLLVGGLAEAQKKEERGSFHGYVDSDICAHLMLGPVTQQRIDCTLDTHKKGSNPALVRATDNWVFRVKNQKKVKKHVGQFAKVSGKIKEKDGTMKVDTVETVARDAIPAGEFDAKLMDVRNYRSMGDPAYEAVRKTLAMMPYITEFDFISFAMAGDHVILTGWTIRITNRKNAHRRVQSIEGVGRITNNIQVLPMGSFDMNIRAGARARLQQQLGRYFWGSGSAIKIIVKGGDIILLGTVATEGDKNIANIQANQVQGAFHVFNLLRVDKEAGTRKKVQTG